jgi:hypothetical protein
MTSAVDRDERTIAVENASYRWAYLFLSFGLLAAVGYRSFAAGEAAWDLLALVVLGGGVAAAYQWSYAVLTKRWLVNGLAGVAAAAAIAALVAWLR